MYYSNKHVVSHFGKLEFDSMFSISVKPVLSSHQREAQKVAA